MLKNDVEKYLNKHGIQEEDLNEVAKKALAVYKKIKAIYERNPDNPIMKENAEGNGEDVIKLISTELKDKSNAPEIRKKAAKAFSEMRKKSLKQVKKNEKALDELEQCRIKLRKDRKRKLESGEIKPPKKKSRATKVKESFSRILKLMPGTDEKVIEQSEKLLRKCATELFKLNGMNKIQLIVKELEEVGDKKSGKEEKKAKAA
jgi:hypothetical protein